MRERGRQRPFPEILSAGSRNSCLYLELYCSDLIILVLVQYWREEKDVESKV